MAISKENPRSLCPRQVLIVLAAEPSSLQDSKHHGAVGAQSFSNNELGGTSR